MLGLKGRGEGMFFDLIRILGTGKPEGKVPRIREIFDF